MISIILAGYSIYANSGHFTSRNKKVLGDIGSIRYILRVMQKVRLTLLRGAHTLEAADELAQKLTDQDIILFENVIPKSDVKAYLNMYMALSKDEPFIDKFGKDLKKNIENKLISKIAWLLRGQNKIYGFVDIKLDEDKLEEQMKWLYSLDALDKMFETIPKNPSNRYQLVNDYADDCLSVLIYRNDVVIKQIGWYINDFYKKFVDEAVAKGGNAKVALVIGCQHRIINDVRKAYPELIVKENIYNRDGIDLMLLDPYINLMNTKLKNVDEPVDNKQVDYFLFSLYTILGSQNMSSADDDVKSLAKVKPIDNYSAHELKEKVEGSFKS